MSVSSDHLSTKQVSEDPTIIEGMNFNDTLVLDGQNNVLIRNNSFSNFSDFNTVAIQIIDSFSIWIENNVFDDLNAANQIAIVAVSNSQNIVLKENQFINIEGPGDIISFFEVSEGKIQDNSLITTNTTSLKISQSHGIEIKNNYITGIQTDIEITGSENVTLNENQINEVSNIKVNTVERLFLLDNNITGIDDEEFILFTNIVSGEFIGNQIINITDVQTYIVLKSVNSMKIINNSLPVNHENWVTIDDTINVEIYDNMQKNETLQSLIRLQLQEYDKEFENREVKTLAISLDFIGNGSFKVINTYNGGTLKTGLFWRRTTLQIQLTARVDLGLEVSIQGGNNSFTKLFDLQFVLIEIPPEQHYSRNDNSSSVNQYIPLILISLGLITFFLMLDSYIENRKSKHPQGVIKTFLNRIWNQIRFRSVHIDLEPYRKL